jgi:sugar diacid utilization regulator
MSGSPPQLMESGAAAAEPGELARYHRAVRALGEVAEAISDEKLELDDLLHLVAERICELSGVRRCGLYLREERGGLFRGCVGHADHDIDAGIRRLAAGIPADRLTAEIVETGRPVFVRNALEDPRTIRATMREWNVRSILGVPMVLRGETVGIVFLDDVDNAHEFSDAEQELSAAFANLAAAAIAQAKLTTELRSSIETMARQNTALRRAATIEDRLTTLVLEGANLRQIAQAVADLTNRPCAVHDASGSRRAIGVPPGGRPDLMPNVLDPRYAYEPLVKDALAALHTKRAAVIGPFPALGMHHRYLMAPVVARGEQWGYVILTEHGSRFGGMDALIAPRAATIVALEMSAENRVACAEWDAGESLLSELVRGNRDRRALERRADVVGVDLTRPHVVVLVRARAEHAAPLPSAREVADAARRVLGDAHDILATGTAEGVLLMVGLDEDSAPRDSLRVLAQSLNAVCHRLAPGGALAASLSTVCRDAGDFAGACAELVDLSGVMEELSTGTGHAVHSVDDLGASRMLLLGVNGRSADRFVGDTIGPLLDGSPELLLTLRTFLDASRSIRRCADRLSVHENTVRYRLARVEQLLGLKVASDAEDQLSVQVALLVARLRGQLDGDVAIPEPPVALAG